MRRTAISLMGARCLAFKTSARVDQGKGRANSALINKRSLGGSYEPLRWLIRNPPNVNTLYAQTRLLITETQKS